MKFFAPVLLGLLFLFPYSSKAQTVDPQPTYSPQYIAILQQILALLEQELQIVLANQASLATIASSTTQIAQNTQPVAPAPQPVVNNVVPTPAPTPTPVGTTAVVSPPALLVANADGTLSNIPKGYDPGSIGFKWDSSAKDFVYVSALQAVDADIFSVRACSIKDSYTCTTGSAHIVSTSVSGNLATQHIQVTLPPQTYSYYLLLQMRFNESGTGNLVETVAGSGYFDQNGNAIATPQ